MFRVSDRLNPSNPVSNPYPHAGLLGETPRYFLLKKETSSSISISLIGTGVRLTLGATVVQVLALSSMWLSK